MDIFKNVPLEKSKLPKNVKQIGEVEEDISIYIEDYVYTYLYQYAKTDLSGEKVALLVGEKFEYNNQNVILISGAIKGKDVQKEDGNYKFEKTTWEHVEQSLNKYFKDKIMLGWVDSQPGYGIFMTGNHIDVQNKYFSEENQILYLLDPIERNEGFFIWKNGRLVKVKGFFIYYDRNKDMHEYMLNNKIEVKSDGEKKEKKISLNSVKQDVISKYRKHDRENKEMSQKNIIKMLSSLSMVLFIVCLVIGFGLITCVDRINKLESTALNVNQLKNEYQLSETLNRNVSSLDDIGDDLTADVNTETGDDQQQIIEKNDEQEQSVSVESSIKDTQEATVEDNTQEQGMVASNDDIQLVEYDVPNVYVVQAGDSLNKISMDFYNTTEMVNKILQLNDLDNPNRIAIGQVLKLPKTNK